MKKKGLMAMMEEDYETEDAIRTLNRAYEIRENPKLMKKVKALAKKKMESMKMLADGDMDMDKDMPGKKDMDHDEY